MARELEDPVDRTLHLLFDATRVWGEGRETTLECGITLVASIAHWAHRNQIPVRILGGGLDDRVTEAPGGKGAWPDQREWRQILKDLALVTEGAGREIAETLARVPHGGSVVVAVSAADRTGLQAVLRACSMLHRSVVILLEGFGESSVNDEQLRALRAASTGTVVCRPGQLREVLQSLEAAARPHSSAIGTRSTRGNADLVNVDARDSGNTHSHSTQSAGVGRNPPNPPLLKRSHRGFSPAGGAVEERDTSPGVNPH